MEAGGGRGWHPGGWRPQTIKGPVLAPFWHTHNRVISLHMKERVFRV